jgi:hypothetical protein
MNWRNYVKSHFQSYKAVFITQNHAKRCFWHKFWRKFLGSNLCVEDWRNLRPKKALLLPKTFYRIGSCLKYSSSRYWITVIEKPWSYWVKQILFVILTKKFTNMPKTCTGIYLQWNICWEASYSGRRLMGSRIMVLIGYWNQIYPDLKVQS